MPASLHVLLRVFQVLRRPGRARTLAQTASGACGGADLRFASAKQRCLRRAFIARPPPHPSHADACCGARARKTLRRPRRSADYPDPALFKSRTELVLIACAALASAVGFLRPCPSHASAVRGVRRWRGVKNAAIGAFFRACEGVSAEQQRVVPTRVRARPRHRSTGKTRADRSAQQERARPAKRNIIKKYYRSR